MKVKYYNNYIIYLFIISVFFLGTSITIAGPNNNAGCAIDLNYETRDYSLDISTKDIESQINLDANKSIWIALVAQNVKNLDTYQVEVKFDNERIKFIQGFEDNSFGGITNILKQNGGTTIGFQAKQTKEGVINIANALSGVDFDQAPDGSGILALLEFKVLDNDLNNSISLSNVRYLNSKNVEDEIEKYMNAVINPGENNQAPSISNIENQFSIVNQSIGPIEFTIFDDKTDPNELQINVKSSNKKLVPENEDYLIVKGTGQDRSLTIVPLENENGTSIISIFVNDGSETSVSSFSITVNSIPVIANILDQKVNANSVINNINFSIDDDETDVNDLKIILIFMAILLLCPGSEIFAQLNIQEFTRSNGSMNNIINIYSKNFSIPIFLDEDDFVESIDITVNYNDDIINITNISLTSESLKNNGYSLLDNKASKNSAIFIISANFDLYKAHEEIAMIDFNVTGDFNTNTMLNLTMQLNEYDAKGGFYINNEIVNNLKIFIGNPQNTSSISGRLISLINNNAIPLKNINVLIKGSLISTHTDNNGNYYLYDVPYGKNLIEIQLSDYCIYKKEIDVIEGINLIEQNFTLENPLTKFDTNDDHKIGIQDIIYILNNISQIDKELSSNNKKFCLEDAIRILYFISNTRQFFY